MIYQILSANSGNDAQEMVHMYWLVVEPTPLRKKYSSSSIGMMNFPTEWKNNPNVPNHQTDINRHIYYMYVYHCVSG